MHGLRQSITTLTLFLIGVGLSGCSITLNSNVPFLYQPSLPVADATSYRLGVEKFQDKRPVEDRETTEEIRDLDEKVTVKLLEDLRGSNLFASVKFPPKTDRDEMVLRGEIKRFSWKVSTSPLIWIPILNMLIYLGAPIYDIEAVAQLQVSLSDGKTGKVLAEYTKFAQRENSYSLYNMKAGEAGAELADAFRDVMKQMKEGMLADLIKRQAAQPSL